MTNPATAAAPPPSEFKHPFPLRENCDPTNPYEAFLWMLVALPGMNGAALIMPVDYLQLVSKRLWDLGARPVAEPNLDYQPPTFTGPHWLTFPGSWAPPPQPAQGSSQ